MIPTGAIASTLNGIEIWNCTETQDKLDSDLWMMAEKGFDIVAHSQLIHCLVLAEEITKSAALPEP